MTTNNHSSELLTPAEIAAELKVKPRCVRGWLRAGTLPSSKLGPRTQRVSRADLDAFVLRFRIGRPGTAIQVGAKV